MSNRRLVIGRRVYFFFAFLPFLDFFAFFLRCIPFVISSPPSCYRRSPDVDFSETVARSREQYPDKKYSQNPL